MIYNYYRKEYRFGIERFNRVRRMRIYNRPWARVYMIDFRDILPEPQPEVLLRPPYSRAWVSRCKEYFGSVQKLRAKIGKYFDTMRSKEKRPTLYTLAQYLGITYNTLRAWATGFYDDETLDKSKMNYSDVLNKAIEKIEGYRYYAGKTDRKL